MKNRLHTCFSTPEITEWLVALNGLRLENIALKNRLSDAVRQYVSHAFIEEADVFQQKFVDKDLVIDLLRHDVVNLLTNLHYMEGRDTEINQLQQQARLLETDIQKIVSGFDQMRTSFDAYLSGLGKAG